MQTVHTEINRSFKKSYQSKSQLHLCRCVGSPTQLVSRAGHCGNLCSAHNSDLLYYAYTDSVHGSDQSESGGDVSIEKLTRQFNVTLSNDKTSKVLL